MTKLFTGQILTGVSRLCLVFSSDPESWSLFFFFFPKGHFVSFSVPGDPDYLFALVSVGGTCQSPALPALVRPPAPPLQPSLDIKPFLPFPLDTAAAVNLFPNFNAVSIRSKFAPVRDEKAY